MLARGLAAHREGRLSDAESIYENIIRQHANHFDALHMLGVVALQTNRLERSVRLIDKAIALNSLDGTAFNNRGVVLKKLGRPEEAVASYDRATVLMPDYAEAYNNRGNALQEIGRREEAVANFDRAIALKPDYAEAYCNRGNALQELGRCEEAVASFDRAIALKPGYANAYNDRGVALKRLGRHEDAVASCDRAISLRPDYAEAHHNRGVALLELGYREEAVASLDRAVALKPDYAVAQFALCMAELPILYQDASEIPARRLAYQRRLSALCGAGDRGLDLADLATAVGSSQPFYLAYQGCNDRDLQGLYGAFVCRIMAKRYPPAELAPPPQPGEPVRVGFVSSFFRNHSTWKLPVKGWLSQLDRRRFQLFGYHTAAQKDAETEAAVAMCDRFVQGPLSIDRWRAEILRDAPHVLIYPEIGMDPFTATLAAQRLAAAQCNSWGHPETSGFPTLDYYLSSDLMEPPEGQIHYTERLVRLPNLSVYCEPTVPPQTRFDRKDFGLSSTATVYWCGQSVYKYLPQFDEVFPRIAREAGDCQFVFIQYPLGTYITGLFRQRLNRAFGQFGLRSEDYCVFLPRLDQQDFVAATGQCDIFLDSIGWSGCNSTLECLPYDLPIVTMAGQFMRGRHSTAILKMMGIPETIAETTDDYVATAVRLARDVAWRMGIKRRVSENKHRLYRDRTCISALEEFLIGIARHGSDKILEPPPTTN
jgi:predicted O-linked N-acetylglucosamine transferase (SPINDLY family)